MAGIDAVLTVDPATNQYDFNIAPNGDIESRDFFDTAILYSIFGQRRAAANEVLAPEMRRGWIGNGVDFENGSKIWLFEQERITKTILNRIEDEARKALQWLVDDGLSVSIDDVSTDLSGGVVFLNVTIRRSRDKIIRRSFELWENTGV